MIVFTWVLVVCKIQDCSFRVQSSNALLLRNCSSPGLTVTLSLLRRAWTSFISTCGSFSTPRRLSWRFLHEVYWSLWLPPMILFEPLSKVHRSPTFVFANTGSAAPIWEPWRGTGARSKLYKIQLRFSSSLSRWMEVFLSCFRISTFQLWS